MEEKDFILDFNNCIQVVMYEPDFEYINHDVNYMWGKYAERIQKMISVMSYWKHFDKEELFQQSYIYFVELCKIYNPYYGNNFYPFDRYVFKNLILKLRAYIQKFYLNKKREQPTELNEKTVSTKYNSITQVDNQLFVDYLLSLVSDRQNKILDLTLQGYKQEEIGLKLNISQSRVSVIKKKTLETLKEHLQKEKI